MNQDTRKDPRAKVLTMTVRYKSATLDEFIEHHSYDVSRGGMFIKTPSPFPPGTLLKFEVKIADEQRLMQGVGRVVWKREANDGDNADKPAGMGVKFIKIDDESRRTIDRLVESRAEGDNAFDQGSTSEGSVASRLPVATAPSMASTSSSAPTRPADPPVRSRKSTVIGLGAMKPSGGAARAVAISSGPPRQVPPIPEKPAAEPFFPKSDSRADMPPVEDQTMMKQAKELLADALRYAGGSAEDVKAAAKVSSIPPHVPRPEPHRSVPPRPTKRAESDPAFKATPQPPRTEHVGEDGEAATTIWRANEAAALLAESMKDSMPPEGEEIHGRITARPPAEADAPAFRESEPATVPGTSPEPEPAKPAAKALLDAVDDEASKPDVAKPKKSDRTSDTDPPRRDTGSKPAATKAAAGKAEKPKAAAAVATSERPSSRSRASQAMLEAAQENAESGGGKGVFALVALAAAAGIAFYLTRPAPAPPPALERPPEPARVEPPKEVVPIPTPAISAPEIPTASAAPAESASAAPSASASAAPPASAAPAPSAAPEVPKPVAEKAAPKPPVVRRVVPRRVPKKKVETPSETPDVPSETPPATPPAEAAPEAPPPAPPPATPPAPPSPTPPPLGDNPY